MIISGEVPDRSLVAAIAAGLESAGATIGTEVAIATSAETAAAHFLFRTGFVDGERATVEIDAVHTLNSLRGFFSGAHRNESETARAARFTIRGDENVGHGAELFEGSAEAVFGGFEGKISDV